MTEEEKTIEDDENSYLVVDPDDYQQTRKLKAINDAKDRVRELRKDRPISTTAEGGWQGLHNRTAEAVAMYGSELLPIIEDALEKGALQKKDLETPHGSLETFIHCEGRLPNHEKEELREPSPIVYMAFYRQLERVQRRLGLGLELQENRGPATI